MFNSAFEALGALPGDYYPVALRDEIDAVNTRVYESLNNGVYRTGFAARQEVYEAAVTEVFDWGVAAAIDRNYGGGGTGSPLPLSSQTDTRALIDGYVKFANATFGAGFQHRINHGEQTPTIFDATSNYWWIGGSYLPLPDIALDAQFGRITVSNKDAGGSVIAARAMYFFSKTTAVYVTAGHVFNQRNASFSIDGGVPPPTSTPLPGVNQTGAMVGIRHLF